LENINMLSKPKPKEVIETLVAMRLPRQINGRNGYQHPMVLTL
jgi:hypothetical protein